MTDQNLFDNPLDHGLAAIGMPNLALKTKQFEVLESVVVKTPSIFDLFPNKSTFSELGVYCKVLYTCCVAAFFEEHMLHFTTLHYI